MKNRSITPFLVCVTALGGLVPIGCGGDGGGAGDAGTDAGTDTDTDADTDADADIDGGSDSDEDCPTDQLAPGDYGFTLEHDGETREYNVHVPSRDDTSVPMPLVLNFHGYTSNMNEQESWTGMDATADSGGFVVAYPNGLVNSSDGYSSWNAGEYCCAYGDTDRDDIGFVRALVEQLSSEACIDAKRIYSTGFSNGGYMSHTLGCYASDLFAAIAPVAGAIAFPAAECTPSRPMPVLQIHGTADSTVDFTYGEAAVEKWRELDGCTGDAVETYQNGDAACDTYEVCDDGAVVTLCSIAGLDHCWPGVLYCPAGSPTTDLVANDVIWAFFQQFSLP